MQSGAYRVSNDDIDARICILSQKIMEDRVGVYLNIYSIRFMCLAIMAPVRQ